MVLFAGEVLCTLKKFGNGIEAIATAAHFMFATTITRFGMHTPAQSFAKSKFGLNTKINAHGFRCIGARIVRITTCMERNVANQTSSLASLLVGDVASVLD